LTQGSQKFYPYFQMFTISQVDSTMYIVQIYRHGLFFACFLEKTDPPV
jgi:hypothetical protein